MIEVLDHSYMILRINPQQYLLEGFVTELAVVDDQLGDQELVGKERFVAIRSFFKDFSDCACLLNINSFVVQEEPVSVQRLEQDWKLKSALCLVVQEVSKLFLFFKAVLDSYVGGLTLSVEGALHHLAAV